MSSQKTTYWNERLECAPRHELERHQIARLREQLDYIAAKSPFYRRKLEGARVEPRDIRSMADVRRIPFTDKEELRQSQINNPPWGDFGCITPRDAVRVFQTSGTTGRPVRIMLSRKDWHETFYEQFMHHRCAYGLDEDDVLFFPFNYGLYIAWWGFHTTMEKAGLMVIPGGGLSSRDRLKAMLDWGATVVCGTPSYLIYLAEIARKNGIDLPGSSIGKLIVAGEPAVGIPATRKAIESQWGAQCFDDIGSTEITNFGYDCLEHQGAHVLESMFIAEVVDPETLEPAPEGEIGELILTNLYCESMPLVRYRTRDLVRFERRPCTCGRTNVRLDGGILGRSDDMFHFAGVNVFPGQIQNLLHQVNEFSQEYQIFVPRLGSGKHLKIQVEPAHAGLSSAQLKRACDYLVEMIKYRISITPDVELCETGTLPRVEGKAKRIIRES